MFNQMNLGRTQRDIIRDEIRQEAETNFTSISEQAPRTENVTVDETSRYDRQKKLTLWPKIIAFIIGVVILIGALVALIWFFKDESKDGGLGNIIEQPEKEPACKDVSIDLGNALNFTCNITTNGMVKAEFANSIIFQGNKPSFTCTTVNDNNEKINPFTCKSNHTVSCATTGKILVTFYDSYDEKNQKVVTTKALHLTIAENPPNASVVTEYDDNDGTIKEFHLTCEHNGTCDSYQMVFNAGSQRITENMNCSESYTGSTGYTSVCKATVSRDMMYSYGHDSRIYCQLYFGSRLKGEEEFVIQKCSDFNHSDPKCQNGSDLFSCDDIDDRDESIFCDNECDLLNTCFSSRHVTLSDSGTCDDKRCALKWCRNETTGAIDNSGKIPYKELLCRR